MKHVKKMFIVNILHKMSISKDVAILHHLMFISIIKKKISISSPNCNVNFDNKVYEINE